ncbi:unnamed protein product [Darwinula stevensoni]|nr:unnamed protein product [Darwinula stevensoni]CAG0879878.1 unnamed protein product [Darwinula stevensoni]
MQENRKKKGNRVNMNSFLISRDEETEGKTTLWMHTVSLGKHKEYEIRQLLDNIRTQEFLASEDFRKPSRAPGPGKLSGSPGHGSIKLSSSKIAMERRPLSPSSEQVVGSSYGGHVKDVAPQSTSLKSEIMEDSWWGSEEENERGGIVKGEAEQLPNSSLEDVDAKQDPCCATKEGIVKSEEQDNSEELVPDDILPFFIDNTPMFEEQELMFDDVVESKPGVHEKFSEKLRHIGDSDFKSQYLHNLKANALSDYLRTCATARCDLVANSCLDNQFKEELEAKQSNGRYLELHKFRQKLPSYKMRHKILELVSESQVVVLSGETGCGKTTQVAQFILDDWILQGKGSVCHIICTQPRRISAISVAERVAQERAEKCGHSVGYQIRLDDVRPRTVGSILYCTTGILLKFLQSDPLLKKASHVVLDEIHERDILSDFTMAIMKDVLTHRPDLKLVLMSATMNAGLFTKYYNNCPLIHIPGFTFPVEELYLEDVLQLTGFRFFFQRFKMESKSKNYGSHYIPRKKQKQLQQYQDSIGPFIRDLRASGKYKSHVLKSIADPSSEGDENLELIASLVEHICQHEPPGAVLIFLPGWDRISKLHKILSSNSFFRRKHLIIPLHSMMPTVNQREVFNRPPPGVRKIVIATNIAETSITIDDVVYVIDGGKIKMRNFDEGSNLQTLLPEWVSLANAKQRKGRAGRVQPGICYHLYTRWRESLLDAFPTPEIQRTRLEELCLQIKILKLGKIEPFLEKVIEPPSKSALHLSIQILHRLNALDWEENLTPLGFHLAKLPMDPQTGKMILMGAIFSCLDPILTVAAALSFKDPFVIPLGQEEVADRRRQELAGGEESDHLMLANVFNKWEEVRQAGRSAEDRFLWHYFLSRNTLEMLRTMKRQLTEHLMELGFVTSSAYNSLEVNQNSKNPSLLKAIICAGLYPNVAKIFVKKNRVTLYTPEDGQKVQFHLKSVLVDRRDFSSQWLVYKLKQKSSAVFLFDATVVSPFSLLFFGERIGIEKHSRGDGLISADPFVHFKCSQSDAILVKVHISHLASNLISCLVYLILTFCCMQQLRGELDKLLEYKISHPGVTQWDPETKEGAILRAIVELITTNMKMPAGSLSRSSSQDFSDDLSS